MPTEVLSVDDSKNYGESVRRAAQIIRDGGLVGFPTETVYGIGVRGDRREAVAALRKVKQRQASKPFTVHIGQLEDVHRFVPQLCGFARRFIRRAWPGPLTVIFPVEDPAEAPVIQELGASCADLMYAEGTIGLRCPANRTASNLLTEAGVPVVAASANRAGQPPPRSAEGVLAELDGALDLLLDGGIARYAQPSTVVRLAGSSYEVLREGVLDARALKRYGSLGILFVCTGNTCRSPMAVGLCRRALASRLGVQEADLEAKGISVFSAGGWAASGRPASEGAIGTMAAKGIDMSDHVSQPLNVELINRADHIFCMTRAHMEAVVSLVPSAESRTELLGGDVEIADPIGGQPEVYRGCAEKIEAALAVKLSEIEP